MADITRLVAFRFIHPAMRLQSSPLLNSTTAWQKVIQGGGCGPKYWPSLVGGVLPITGFKVLCNSVSNVEMKQNGPLSLLKGQGCGPTVL